MRDFQFHRRSCHPPSSSRRGRAVRRAAPGLPLRLNAFQQYIDKFSEISRPTRQNQTFPDINMDKMGNFVFVFVSISLLCDPKS